MVLSLQSKSCKAPLQISIADRTFSERSCLVCKERSLSWCWSWQLIWVLNKWQQRLLKVLKQLLLLLNSAGIWNLVSEHTQHQPRTAVLPRNLLVWKNCHETTMLIAILIKVDTCELPVLLSILAEGAKMVDRLQVDASHVADLQQDLND